jgi:type IV secretion system protein VirB3
MATQTLLFLGLIRPPKLIGLPIMYAMVWLFGFVLLFLWVQSWPVIVVAALAVVGGAILGHGSGGIVLSRAA